MTSRYDYMNPPPSHQVLEDLERIPARFAQLAAREDARSPASEARKADTLTTRGTTTERLSCAEPATSNTPKGNDAAERIPAGSSKFDRQRWLRLGVECERGALSGDL